MYWILKPIAHLNRNLSIVGERLVLKPWRRFRFSFSAILVQIDVVADHAATGAWFKSGTGASSRRLQSAARFHLPDDHRRRRVTPWVCWPRLEVGTGSQHTYGRVSTVNGHAPLNAAGETDWMNYFQATTIGRVVLRPRERLRGLAGVDMYKYNGLRSL